MCGWGGDLSCIPGDPLRSIFCGTRGLLFFMGSVSLLFFIVLVVFMCSPLGDHVPVNLLEHVSCAHCIFLVVRILCPALILLLLLLLLFFVCAFPSYISGVHRFLVRFLRM